MDYSEADSFREALELYHAGKHREAAACLAQALRQNPDDERAWHLLSYVLAEPEQQVYALRRVLQINPANRAARSRLRSLDATAPESLAPAPRPAPVPIAPSRPARPSDAVPGPATVPQNRLSRMWRRAISSPALVAGVLILLIFAVVALAAPLIAPPVDAESPGIVPSYGYDPAPTAPSAEHPLGLLPKEHDILYGLVWGTRRAFQAGLTVTLARLVVGVLLGLLAGYYGGWLDALLMRITDAFLSFPMIAAAMVMVALYGVEFYVNPAGIGHVLPDRQEWIVMYALVIFGWMSYTRLIRGNVLAQREKEYMEAARATGIRSPRMIFRHLLPNVTQGLFVTAASDVGWVVVLLATFAFIGLFTPPFGLMEADWGQMLNAARDWIVGSPAHPFAYWYTFLPVSAAIVLFSVGWNLMGDGLRDVLDPRKR